MGFEPMTHSLEGCCSIQLSYQTDLILIDNYSKVGCKGTTFNSKFKIQNSKLRNKN